MAELPRDIPDENLKRWLALTPEDAIDPEQPIIDPHHHLWDRRSLPESPPGSRRHVVYLADELIEDIRGAGHNVIDTVFVECRYKYRRGGGLDAPAGETEFVQDFAAKVASGLYGEGVRCCGAIIGFTDLTLGAQAKEVLLAHQAAGRNFRGIRHAHGWHASPEMPRSHHPTAGTEGLLGLPAFREGFAALDELGLVFDCWGFHSQLEEVADLANAFPGVTIILNHIGGPIALGPYAGQREGRLFEEWKRGIEIVSRCPEHRGQGRRLRDGDLRFRFRDLGCPAGLGNPCRGVATLLRAPDRLLRVVPVHVRVEFPRRQGVVLLRQHVERLQAHRERSRIVAG